MYDGFDMNLAAMQLVERAPWVPAFRIEYYLGIDGFSAPLILLTTFLTPLVVIAGWEIIKIRPAQYFAAFLILEGLMIGVFFAPRQSDAFCQLDAGAFKDGEMDENDAAAALLIGINRMGNV